MAHASMKGQQSSLRKHHNTAPPTTPSPNLKAKALRGGAYIVARQAVGMVLSLIGVLCVTRVIGPTEFGVFAAAYGIVGFAANVGTWGIDVYLIRKPEAVQNSEYALGFTLLLAIGLCFATVTLVARSFVSNLIHIPRAANVFVVLAAYIPISLLALPGVVQLDRALRFRRVAYNELASQILNYAAAVPLALSGAGVWAPTVGLLIQQVSLLTLTYIGTDFHPRLYWDGGQAKRMLTYGLSYSSSIWVWQLRTLINPIIVGRLAGATAVGNVALAIRMADVLSFAKNATWRVAMATLAKLNENRERLRKSIEEGMRLQAVAVGLPLAAFAVLAPLVLPPIFGHRWDSALKVFPFIAIGYLSNCMFNIHSSVLYLLCKNMRVTWFHVTHVIVFVTAVLLFVPLFGTIGYGLGEICAITAYWVIHRAVVESVGSPAYRSALVWFLVAAFAIIASQGNAYERSLAVTILVVPFLVPRERAHIASYARMLLSSSGA